MVLETIKKLIGFDADYNAFDTDLTLYINSTLDTLKQMGVNVIGRLTLGGSEDWSDIIGDDTDLDSVKIYIYLKCRLVFDPPLNASILESIKQQIQEYEYRINFEYEYTYPPDSGEEVDPSNG